MESISSRIPLIINKEGLNISSFEKKIKAANNTISTAIRRNSNLSGEILNKIINEFSDINPEWLLTGKGSMLRTEQQPTLDISKSNITKFKTSKITEPILSGQTIPIFEIYASAGIIENIQQIRTLNPVEYVNLSHIGKVHGGIFAAGDSMHPLIKSGDICIYQEIATQDIRYGHIYLINMQYSTGDHYLVLKYIDKASKPDHVMLTSFNKHHADHEIHIKEIKSLAIVKCTIAKHSY